MEEPFGAPDDGEGQPAPAIVVPDDARELARDVAAWRREERWLRRRHRLERLLLINRPHRRWLVLLLLCACAAVLGLAAATLPLFAPHAGQHGIAQVPLTLAAPAVAPGDVGGLLPDATLSGPDGETSARDLRPALLLLAGTSCSCADALTHLAGQAAENSLPVILIGTVDAESAGQLLSQASGRGTGNVRVLTDVSGVLTQVFEPAPGSLEMVAVHADGVIAEVVTRYTSTTALGPLLATLQQPGA